jgi:hypothetical protein
MPRRRLAASPRAIMSDGKQTTEETPVSFAPAMTDFGGGRLCPQDWPAPAATLGGAMCAVIRRGESGATGGHISATGLSDRSRFAEHREET